MKTFSRRAMLRGVMAGSAVTIALPTFDFLLNENGNAYAQGDALPKRFGIYYWGNGVRPAQWNPSATGVGYTLSPALMPLAPVRRWVSCVSGMNIRTGNERGHHAGTVGILSGAPMIPQDPRGAPYASTFSAPSIDQVIASQIATGTAFRSLEIGISESVVRGEGSTLGYLSHNGPDDFNPPEYSPRALFDRVFGASFVGPDTEPVIDPRLRLRRSVLDAVTQDAADMRRRLGAEDRRRLDQHLTGIRSLEERIAALEAMPDRPPLASCARPTTPAESYGRDELVMRNQVMSEILAMAMACDQTRVFSNMFSGSVSGTRYPDTSGGHHGLTHDEPGEQPMVQAITEFIMERFSDLLQALAAVPEGDGVLLDRCVILASSDTSDARAHSINDYPILVAGGGGGKLRGDVHYRSSGENTSKVLLSCLRAMDLEMESFGRGGGQVSEACTEILV
ncbi:MAG: DUF1552 domain-containing protein [Sandaracinus sp.]|nr:DUF1552 domain-containing protein [Sandaracinus sp.]